MGETLAGGRYEVVRLLARGGMGEVLLAEFLGRRPRNDQTIPAPEGQEWGGDQEAHLSGGLVVIKRLLPEAERLPNHLMLLREEGRIATRLLHENLVETYFLDEDRGTPLLIMEFLAGSPVSHVLGQAKKLRVPVPLDVALRIVRQAACGLHFAHTLMSADEPDRPLGIVHRDVSPTNVLLTFDGRVKVIDFGVAKAADGDVRTATGLLKGKVGYMSPEQVRSEKLGPASDVWALGVLFWETLCAERLFISRSPQQTLSDILQRPIPPPSALRPGLAPEVDALCARMLSRDLAARFASCAEVVRAVDALPIAEAAARPDLGAFLRERFPDEAASIAADAARCARMARSEPVARDLASGSAQRAALEAVPTRVVDLFAYAQATAGAQPTEPGPADEVPAVPHRVDRAAMLGVDTIAEQPAPRLPEAPPVHAPPVHAPPVRAPRAEALRPEPPLASPPRTDPRLASAPRTDPRQVARAAARRTTVAFAAASFGAAAFVAGVVLAGIAPSMRAPHHVFAAPDANGVDVLFGRVPPGSGAARAVVLDAPTLVTRSGDPPRSVAPDALLRALEARHVLDAARADQQPRAFFVRLFPWAIAALGLVLLAAAAPGLLTLSPRRRTRARAIGTVAALGISAAVIGGGARAWPGLRVLWSNPSLRADAADVP